MNTMTPSTERYSGPAIGAHWIIALLILGQLRFDIRRNHRILGPIWQWGCARPQASCREAQQHREKQVQPVD